ncbi:MAG: hypothetical protein ACRD4Y_12350, partial [Candidatus Acidiferrales bacterium]
PRVMLRRLGEQRERTLAVLEGGHGSDLRSYRLQHPLLGSLHYYNWFRTLAEHDVRHAKQLSNVKDTLANLTSVPNR